MKGKTYLEVAEFFDRFAESYDQQKREEFLCFAWMKENIMKETGKS